MSCETARYSEPSSADDKLKGRRPTTGAVIMDEKLPGSSTVTSSLSTNSVATPDTMEYSPMRMWYVPRLPLVLLTWNSPKWEREKGVCHDTGDRLM